MLVIAKRPLREFWERYPEAEQPLKTWHAIVSTGTFAKPGDVKRVFGSVDFVRDNRAIFNIGGNKYRLVAHFAFPQKAVMVKFVGTHAEYDRIDPATVELRR